MAMKRFLHHDTQTVQINQQTENPLKKIRITSKSLILENITSSKQALKLLINTIDGENTDNLSIKTLSEHFRNEEESVVRVKVLSIFSEFCLNRLFDPCNAVDEIVSLMKEEKSTKVICQGLNSLYKIGKLQGLSKPYLNKITAFAQERLLCESHNIQRHSLLILGALSEISYAESTILNLVGQYTDSQDSRVRTQAFNSLLNLGRNGVLLPTSLFTRCCNGLADDCECVRKEALHLLFEIASRHPEAMITLPDTDSDIRLIDAAFEKVCSALCDFSLQVRILAAELLGKMTQVSQEFLHQTLDKKLMSNLKRKKSLHERCSENFAKGEWSTGKKWMDDAPKEQVEANTVSLIASGACGALVHGLEDEFVEVRTASVDSMCKLALINPEFAMQSLDFLVDMFNDEIEDVRLKAIYSLIIISNHIMLREDQLEIMLSSLEDHSTDIREGLHLMLGSCKVSTHTCLLMVVHKVLSVLSQYPEDKFSAYGCMQKIGEKHSEICMTLTPQLLLDHPCFDCAERDVEDPSYICILIMLFNAAVHKTAMLNLFPDVTIKHYFYLRDTMPNLVPHLPIEGISSPILLTTLTGSSQFLETISNSIHAFCKTSKARSTLLKATLDKLSRLAEIDYLMSGAALFTATFLEAQLLIEQLRMCALNHQSRVPSKSSLSQLMKNCLKLQNLFSGLSVDDLLHVKEISLRASAIHLILVVKDRSQSALSSCQLLLHIASDIRNFLHLNTSKTPDNLTTVLLNKLSNINDPKPGRVFREICPIVQNASPIVTPKINIDIRMCKARITEPSTAASMENILKVTAGLIAAFNLVAEIENLEEAQREDLRLKIKYPDQNVHIVSPRTADLKRTLSETGEIKKNHWRLRTTVLLSHGVWTESSFVEITLCLFVRPTELELSKPIKILFSPKPVRRGF
ncbi:integrator complex subunit 4 [Condylostylus longicornis]|uniref:integrator complex subunit 4 n=1 Tax=Condylostylus longicornis TaxID=2530218 RepID=UPI00244E290C|nr:integrator complex subunit 4 [Condylostylus longicornis]